MRRGCWAPDDTVVYDGGLDQPPGWLDLARRGNACVVLIGTIGLYGYLGDKMRSWDLRLLLTRPQPQANSSAL
jgi:hypothetical protein